MINEAVEWSEYPLAPEFHTKITHYTFNPEPIRIQTGKWMISVHSHSNVIENATGEEVHKMKMHAMNVFDYDEAAVLRKAERIVMLLNDEISINVMNMD